MKNLIFWLVLVGNLLLGTCGNVDDAEEGARAEQVDPWRGVGKATLPADDDAVTDDMRTLEFDDGMIVVYDGSDPRGAEQVCRRREREGVLYQVCMSLEHDPYFAMSEQFSLAWHPLIFENFGVVLVCKINDDVKDCEEVFSFMGGPSFYCEASIFRGDRALRCFRPVGGGGQWK